MISVVLNKPWTTELSAAGVGVFATNPAFIRANQWFSGMWEVIFAWFAIANWQDLEPIYRWVPMIAGGLVTIVGPKILKNIAVRRGVIKEPRAK